MWLFWALPSLWVGCLYASGLWAELKLSSWSYFMLGAASPEIRTYRIASGTLAAALVSIAVACLLWAQRQAAKQAAGRPDWAGRAGGRTLGLQSGSGGGSGGGREGGLEEGLLGSTDSAGQDAGMAAALLREVQEEEEAVSAPLLVTDHHNLIFIVISIAMFLHRHVLASCPAGGVRAAVGFGGIADRWPVQPDGPDRPGQF